ncbi:unnamed protein product [Arabidopsis thaliana]|uniref:(thale cress) hypothetical protein n=1 Tax=Arabidopsis thaliana TaxID=3702 RepID=A0A7G2EN14_ARATH|nr:unnamed protein product [Arabidopsis thaliana]
MSSFPFDISLPALKVLAACSALEDLTIHQSVVDLHYSDYTLPGSLHCNLDSLAKVTLDITFAKQSNGLLVYGDVESHQRDTQRQDPAPDFFCCRGDFSMLQRWTTCCQQPP